MLEDDVKKGVYIKVPFSIMFISDVNVRYFQEARMLRELYRKSYAGSQNF